MMITNNTNEIIASDRLITWKRIGIDFGLRTSVPISESDCGVSFKTVSCFP